jgi:hypothetical protein
MTISSLEEKFNSFEDQADYLLREILQTGITEKVKSHYKNLKLSFKTNFEKVFYSEVGIRRSKQITALFKVIAEAMNDLPISKISLTKTIALGILGAACGTITGSGLFNCNLWLTALTGIIEGIALPIIFNKPNQKIPFFLSKIDKDTVITPDRWVVTLTQKEGKCGQHAALIIEGIENNFYFIKIAHLTGTSNPGPEDKIATVKYYDYDHSEVTYDRRSQSLVVSAEKGRKMIAEIEKEKDKFYSLNILGRYSVFSKQGQDSCITWALEKLKLVGIHRVSQHKECIVTKTSDYTQSKEFHDTFIPEARQVIRQENYLRSVSFGHSISLFFRSIFYRITENVNRLRSNN